MDAVFKELTSSLWVSKSKKETQHQYKLHVHVLEHAPSAKYLRITIQSDAKFHTHINLSEVGARLPLRQEYKRPCTQKSTPLGVLAGVNSL